MDHNDFDLVKLLQTNDPTLSRQVAEEVLARGERMIGLLLQQQGNTSRFAGALGNPKASTAMIAPLPGLPLTPAQQENVVTVEVAALYLISGIYYGRLDFASSAFLTDLSLDPIDRRAVNRKEYIIRAFESVRNWASACRSEGLERLRARGEDPLKKARLAWW